MQLSRTSSADSALRWTTAPARSPAAPSPPAPPRLQASRQDGDRTFRAAGMDTCHDVEGSQRFTVRPTKFRAYRRMEHRPRRVLQLEYMCLWRCVQLCILLQLYTVCATGRPDRTDEDPALRRLEAAVRHRRARSITAVKTPPLSRRHGRSQTTTARPVGGATGSASRAPHHTAAMSAILRMFRPQRFHSDAKHDRATWRRRARAALRTAPSPP